MSKGSVTNTEHQFAIRLMQHLVVPTFVLDPEGRVMIWNNACERLTNVSAKEVLGTKDHWKAFYEEQRECLADLVLQERTNDIEELYAAHSVKDDLFVGFRAENWAVMPRASKRLYLAINCGPIYDDDGNMIAVVETLRDMTEQKRAEEALQSLAHKDGLTNLANRRSFDISLEADLLHAQREGEHLSLLLCDVDHFKPYNDTYGHQKGDECLKDVAKVVGDQALRPTDLSARYGGEEFAVILPGSTAEGAMRVAERMRQAIFDLKLEHKSSLTSDRVTMSVGAVSLIPKPDMEPGQLIEMADEALYQAKQTGRNKVGLYGASS
ncbi:diguanylate cyclase [Terasakiella sp. A23]|uniref:sensor domain-containing diguanylate cyclase n=1 Tax=Terasakiella sp. FCG-A23 TaxID=3080561 RepID=UPI002954D78D|nr:diguanylate cyclase [Terasakiella sp. A23]MDV7339563.1 diguanylate cyclase [Terasakiella sp. A23]